jgi:hypothetical protein
MATESSFTNYIAASERSALVEGRRFTANVVSVREPYHYSDALKNADFIWDEAGEARSRPVIAH